MNLYAALYFKNLVRGLHLNKTQYKLHKDAIAVPSALRMLLIKKNILMPSWAEGDAIR